MLDWSTFDRPILLRDQLKFEQLFNAIKQDNNSSFFNKEIKGMCYLGGESSQLIIKLPNKIGIKIYNNSKTNDDKIKFHNQIRKHIYKNNERIQNVYKCSKLGNTAYAIQEWIEGDTLTEMYYNNKLNYSSVRMILNELYLKLIIPLWKEGLVWKIASATNLCFYNNKLIRIDTDNMVKTAAEILENKNFVVRNEVRRNSYIKDRILIYDMFERSNIRNYNSSAFDELHYIYTGNIDFKWEEEALECYSKFLKTLKFNIG
jgi:serine/threonine protein kinase